MIFGTQSRADAEKKLPQGLALKVLEFYCDDRKSLLFTYTGATSAPAHIFPLFFCKSPDFSSSFYCEDIWTMFALFRNKDMIGNVVQPDLRRANNRNL